MFQMFPCAKVHCAGQSVKGGSAPPVSEGNSTVKQKQQNVNINERTCNGMFFFTEADICMAATDGVSPPS